MDALIVIFEWLLSIADAIILGVITFFGIIILIIAFATSDRDDYWAEGGMSIPDESSIESSRNLSFI